MKKIVGIIFALILFSSQALAYFGTDISASPTVLDSIKGTMWDFSYGGDDALYIFGDETESISGYTMLPWRNSEGSDGYVYYGFDGMCCYGFIVEIDLKNVLSFSIDGESASGFYYQEDAVTSGLWGMSSLTGVFHVNQPPVADAGVDFEANSGDTIRLDQSASSDPDDGVYIYHWERLDDGPVIESDSFFFEWLGIFTVPEIGDEDVTMQFLLTVTDHGGLTDTDIVNVIVRAENTFPVYDGATCLDLIGRWDIDHGDADITWTWFEWVFYEADEDSATGYIDGISGDVSLRAELQADGSIKVTEIHDFGPTDVFIVQLRKDENDDLFFSEDDIDNLILFDCPCWIEGKKISNVAENPNHQDDIVSNPQSQDSGGGGGCFIGTAVNNLLTM